MTARGLTDSSRPEGGYIPEIDGLRAVAVGAVMLYHLSAALVPGGFIGVDVFFVISGYVVSASLGRDAGRSVLGFLGHFYARRMLRILPPLLLCLLAASLATALFIPQAWLSDSIQKTGLYAFFGISNYALLGSDPYFSPRPEFNPFTHTWSLAVEEQFYLVYPLLFFAWARLRRGTGGLAILARGTVAALSVASLVYVGWMSRANPDAAFYLLTTRFWELGAGALLFQMQASGVRIPDRLRPALLTVGPALVAVAAAFADRTGFPFPWALPAVAGSWMIIAAVSAGAESSTPSARLLRSAPMLWVGRLSYSLYLWHWAVYSLFRWTIGLQGLALSALAVALTFALAAGSYYLVERPARRGAWLKALPAGLIVVGGLAAVVLAQQGAGQIFASQPKLSLSQVTQEREKWYPGSWPGFDSMEGCPIGPEHGAVQGITTLTIRRHCPTPAPAEQWRRLFVLGDSHAGAYTAMLFQLARQHDVELRIFSQGGCPVADLLRPARSDCAAFARAVLVEIGKQARPGDAMFLASLRTDRMSDQGGVFDDAMMQLLRYGETAAENRRIAYREAVDILDGLTRIGLRIIIDAPKPVFRAANFRCSDWFNRNNPSCVGGLAIPRAELIEHRRPVMEALAQLKAAYPSMTVWDAFPILCPEENCRAMLRSGPLFFDGDHLSGLGNKTVYPAFRELMERIWGQG